MNIPLLIAGILSALAAVVHAGGGELTDIRNLMASDVPLNEKIELRAVWHTFSIALAGSALLAFYAILIEPTLFVKNMLQGLAIFHLLCGLMWLLITLVTQRSYLLKVPQWILLIATGALLLWGIAGLGS